MPHLTLFSQSFDLAMVADWGHYLGLLAQTFEDNLGSDISGAFENFIESGQVWALGIGFILGYIVRSLTAY
jgi:hypothetical protein